MRYLIIILFLLVSCGAKKKAVERGSEKMHELRSKSFNMLTVNTRISSIEFKRFYVANFKKTGKRMSFEAFSPEKPVTYTDNSGHSFTVKGAKQFTVEDYEINIHTTDSILKTTSNEDKSSSLIEASETSETWAQRSWRNVKSLALRSNTWISIIIILIALYLLNRKFKIL